MKCSSMPMRTVTVVSGIGRYNEMFSRLSSNFPAGPSSRRWSSPSLWVVWACQGAGPGPRLWPAHLLAPPPAPSQCRGWPGWRPQVKSSHHLIISSSHHHPVHLTASLHQVQGACLWAGLYRPPGSRWVWPSQQLSECEPWLTTEMTIERVSALCTGLIRWHWVISQDTSAPLKNENCNHCPPSHQMIDTIDKKY